MRRVGEVGRGKTEGRRRAGGRGRMVGAEDKSEARVGGKAEAGEECGRKIKKALCGNRRPSNDCLPYENS